MILGNATTTQFAFALSVVILLSGCSGSASDNTNSLETQSSLDTGAISSDDAMTVSDNGSDMADTELNTVQQIPGTELSIRSDNYLHILRTAVEATNTTSLFDDAESIRELAEELRSEHYLNALPEKGLTLTSEVSFEASDDSINVHYSCDAGGSMVLSLSNLFRKMSFDDCFVGLDQYDGDFSSYVHQPNELSMNFNLFSVKRADGSSFSIDGRYGHARTRVGVNNSTLWNETDYVKKDASGIEFKQLGLNLSSGVKRDIRDLDRVAGYVTLPDGTVGLAAPFYDNASIVAEFDLYANFPEPAMVKVSSDMFFDGDYFRWVNIPSAPDTELPTYPVSDLGNPLMANTTGSAGGASILLDTRPQVPVGSEQWNTGSLTVTAEDGSQVVMSPTLESTETIDVRLIGASDLLTHSWSDGLQIKCPIPITGC